MKSLNLYSCRSPYLDSDKIYPPLGLLYLKAAVNQALPDVRVNLIDDYNLDSLPEANFHGISIMTPQRAEAIKLREAIRRQQPMANIIAGGPHVKHYAQECIQDSWDWLVTNDGQRSIIEILNGNAKRTSTDNLLPQEWASQPQPDRTSPEAIRMLQGYKYTLNGRRATTMLTATGCPMECAFCEDARTAVRWSPLEKITRELDDIKALNYGAVYLFDDLFAIAMPKVRPICEELRKRDLIYRCNGQANFFTKWGEDFAKMLAETGCYEIAFGHESGSQVILDNVRKRTSVKQNYDSVAYAKKHGIVVKSFLMLGLPGETLETIAETERFIKEAKPDDFQLAVYYPYKGTAIRDAIDRGESTGLIFEGEGLGAYGQKGGSSEAVVRTPSLSAKELLQIRDDLVRRYKPESHIAKWKDNFHDTHIVLGGN